MNQHEKAIRYYKKQKNYPFQTKRTWIIFIARKWMYWVKNQSRD